MTGHRDERRNDPPTGLLAAIANSSAASVFVKDREGRYTFVNRHMADLWGRDPVDILGRDDFDLFPTDLARRVREHDEAVATERRAGVFEEGLEFGGERGRYVSSRVPLFNEGGEVHAIYGIATDVTSHLRGQETWLESDSRFRELADAVPSLLWVSDDQEKGVFFNRTWLEFTGQTLEETLGDGWLRRVHPEDHERLGECSRAFGERMPFQVRFRLRRKDGQYRWMLDTGVPRIEPDGTFAGYIGSCTDFTDQVHLENLLRAQAETLAEHDRQKEVFLAMLGHELRNPIAPIRHVIEFFHSRRDALEPELRKALRIADHQLAHIRRLVDDLLDVARIARGEIRLRRRQVRLKRAVRDTADGLEHAFASKRVDMSVEGDFDPLVVDGDPDRINQVLHNLLHNALKYTPAGGSVTISGGVDGDTAVIRISDTGEGIPPDRLEDMFELFRQGDQDLSRPRGGLGLGLPIVRRMVELHGGRVEAESGGIGHGATFSVYLPSLQEAEASPESTSPAPHPPARKILVVDDHVESTDSLAMLLSLYGHDVIKAYDGNEGLRIALEEDPDVVLLDIGLPGLDGYEIAEAITKHANGDSPVLVALTGYGQPSAEKRIHQVGFDHYMLKPIDFEALKHVLAEIGSS